MSLSSRLLAASLVVTAGSALIAGTASPSSASALTADASPTSSHSVTATVSPTPYAADLSSNFPGYGTEVDDSKAVVFLPAGSTRMTFDLGADAAVLQLTSVEYWVGTTAKPLHGTAAVEHWGRSVSIDIPGDTFTVDDTDAYFDLEATTAPPAGTLLPPAGRTTGYSYYASGALKTTPSATAAATIELPAAKAVAYVNITSYWASPDSTRALEAGDHVVLAAGRPGFFPNPLPSRSARLDGIEDSDQTGVDLPSTFSSDASNLTMTVSQEAVDILGPRRSSNLTVFDRLDQTPPTSAPSWASINTTVTVPVTLADPTAALRSYIIALYHDYLDRTPAESEIEGWVDGLKSGLPRTSVAQGFVNSDEYRLDRIDAAYRTVLHREPETAGRLNWLHGMQSGALTPDDIETSFYASTEYFQQHGGSNTSWTAALYSTLLNRTGTTADYAFWAGLAAQHGRPWVIAQFWDSRETIGARVTAMYQRYLGRAPDARGLANWVGVALQIGDSGLRAALTSSDEYVATSRSRYPQH